MAGPPCPKKPRARSASNATISFHVEHSTSSHRCRVRLYFHTAIIVIILMMRRRGWALNAVGMPPRPIFVPILLLKEYLLETLRATSFTSRLAGNFFHAGLSKRRRAELRDRSTIRLTRKSHFSPGPRRSHSIKGSLSRICPVAVLLSSSIRSSGGDWAPRVQWAQRVGDLITATILDLRM